MTLEIGDKAPDFTLQSTAGGEVHLYEVLLQHSVVLSFFLKAFTPVCTAQVCGFRDASSEFVEHGAAVFGISSDSLETAARFAKSLSLSFPLLADTDGRVRAAYRVPKAFGLIPGRATYVIGQDSRIKHISNAALRAGAHIKESKAAVAG